MELEGKVMQVIYSSGYEPVPGNHKRGHMDIEKLKEGMVRLFDSHYGDISSACGKQISSLHDEHVVEKKRLFDTLVACQKELATLRARNWYQRLFNL